MHSLYITKTKQSPEQACSKSKIETPAQRVKYFHRHNKNIRMTSLASVFIGVSNTGGFHCYFEQINASCLTTES